MTLIFPTSNFRVVGIFHLDTIVKRHQRCFVLLYLSWCHMLLYTTQHRISLCFSCHFHGYWQILLNVKISDASGSSCSFDFIESLDTAPASLWLLILWCVDHLKKCIFEVRFTCKIAKDNKLTQHFIHFTTDNNFH